VKLCGIYMIENHITGKKYIGQSVNISKRFKNHIYELLKNIHPNSHLQRAWNFYGQNSFSFEILCECKPEELDNKEIYYILLGNSIKDGYNQVDGGRTEKRRFIKNKCIECGIKTETGYLKYCKNHKNKCQKCGERYGDDFTKEEILILEGTVDNPLEHKRTCPGCRLEKAKKIYNILTTGVAF